MAIGTFTRDRTTMMSHADGSQPGDVLIIVFKNQPSN